MGGSGNSSYVPQTGWTDTAEVAKTNPGWMSGGGEWDIENGANPYEGEYINVITTKWYAVEKLIGTLQTLLLGTDPSAISDIEDGYFGELYNLVSDSAAYDLPDDWLDELSDFSITQFNDLVTDGRVTILPSGIDIEGYDWPTDADKPELRGQLQTVPDIDTSFTAPTAVESESAAVDFQESPYVSILHEELFSELYTELTNGDALAGSAAVETALSARAKDRVRQSNDANWQKAINATSSGGFNFAGGEEAAVLTTISNEILQQNTNIENDTFIKLAELAQEWNKFIIERGADYEKLLRDYHNSVQDRSLKAKVETVRLVIQKFAEGVKGYLAEWQGITESMRAKVAAAEVVATSNKVIADIYETDARVYQLDLDTITTKLKAEIDNYDSYIRGKDIEVREQESWWKALTDEQKNHVQEQELLLKRRVDYSRLLLESALSYRQFKEKVLEAMSNIAAQVLASALGAVNATVQHQTSMSESRKEAWNHGESLQETHSFKED